MNFIMKCGTESISKAHVHLKWVYILHTSVWNFMQCMYTLHMPWKEKENEISYFINFIENLKLSRYVFVICSAKYYGINERKNDNVRVATTYNMFMYRNTIAKI